MSENSALTQRLQRQLQSQNEIIQSLVRKQLLHTQNELRSTLKEELNTISADIRDQSQMTIWKMFRSRILMPSLIGISLCLGLFGGSWGLMQYQASRIIEMQKTINQLESIGGGAILRQCESRLCVQVDPTVRYGENYMVIEGY